MQGRAPPSPTPFAFAGVAASAAAVQAQYLAVPGVPAATATASASVYTLPSADREPDVVVPPGGFAHVYIVKSEFLEELVLKRTACPDSESAEELKNEIDVMKSLSGHKNVVKYYDSSVTELRHGGYEVLILMEYCSGGHLVDLLNSRLHSRLGEREILNIFSDVCEAVAHMHFQPGGPIVHRDIKAENVLIASNGSTYKLCDFGSSSRRRIPPNTPLSVAETRKLEEDIDKHTTLQYRAPEICDLYQRKEWMLKADVTERPNIHQVFSMPLEMKPELTAGAAQPAVITKRAPPPPPPSVTPMRRGRPNHKPSLANLPQVSGVLPPPPSALSAQALSPASSPFDGLSGVRHQNTTADADLFFGSSGTIGTQPSSASKSAPDLQTFDDSLWSNLSWPTENDAASSSQVTPFLTATPFSTSEATSTIAPVTASSAASIPVILSPAVAPAPSGALNGGVASTSSLATHIRRRPCRNRRAVLKHHAKVD
ncbi:hypothetical protein HK405_000674 [Cladochytrium tenue]|nr:hypothetical protein HK405_000674 [Cladochytrium tenue]